MIYLLEDDITQQKRIKQYIQHIHTFTSPANLLSAVLKDKTPKIILLDLEIKDVIYAGLQTAQLIRKNDIISPIIIVTTHCELSWHTFQHHISALDFIDKSQPESAFAQQLKSAIYTADKVLKRYDKKSPNLITIRNGAHLVQFDLNHLSYVSSNKGTHYINVFTKNGVSKIRNTIKTIASSHENFIQIHASFCINRDFIKQYLKSEKIIELTDGTLLPVTRKFQHHLIQFKTPTIRT